MFAFLHATPIEIVGADAPMQEAHAALAEHKIMRPQVFASGENKVLLGLSSYGWIVFFDLTPAGVRQKTFGPFHVGNRAAPRFLFLVDPGQRVRGDFTKLKRRFADRLFELNGRLFVVDHSMQDKTTVYLDELEFGVGYRYPFEIDVPLPSRLTKLTLAATGVFLAGLYEYPSITVPVASAFYAFAGLKALAKEQSKLGVGARAIPVGDENGRLVVFGLKEDQFGIEDAGLLGKDHKQILLTEWMQSNACPKQLAR